MRDRRYDRILPGPLAAPRPGRASRTGYPEHFALSSGHAFVPEHPFDRMFRVANLYGGGECNKNIAFSDILVSGV